jgi:hypothetical protein
MGMVTPAELGLECEYFCFVRRCVKLDFWPSPADSFGVRV